MFRPGFLIIIIFSIIVGCQDAKDENRAASPRVKKSTSFVSPTSNQRFIRGNQIELSFAREEGTIDSVQISLEGEDQMFKGANFSISLPNRKVGTWSIRAKVYFGAKTETHYKKIIVLPERAPQEMTYRVINSYPHDTEDFTQGLLIKDGYLYESTGQKGYSSFKRKELKSGKSLQVRNLSNEYFGEGLAEINNEFYQLTWTSGIGFVYNMDMEQIRTFNFSGQGYGLTTLGDQLVFTDESEKLYFVEPQSFTVQDQIEAYDNSGKADSLNELEVINGLIYANVWLRDIVVVVDPSTGEVVKRIDFTGLLSDEKARKARELNGIAYDPATEKMYVTGKNWPKLFEVTLEPKTIQ